MRKEIKYLVGIILFIFLTIPTFSKEQIFYQNRDLDLMLHDIKKPQAPIVTDDYIIFTCDSKYRYAGIAFDFENYQTVHPFEVFTSVDDEDVKSRDFMFYVYKRQHKFTTIKYRSPLEGQAARTSPVHLQTWNRKRRNGITTVLSPLQATTS